MKLLLKILGILVGLIILILIITTVSNLILSKRDRASIEEYGEKVQVNGQNMNVSIQGDGEKTIVLLPGFGTGSPVLDFTPIVSRLSKQYRTIVIEPLNYGLSDSASSERTVENMTEEIHACLQNLGVSRYTLMPHSISGIYSLYYCNQYPEEVEALIGIDTSVPNQMDYMSEDGGTTILYLLSDLGLLRAGVSLFPTLLLPADADASYTPEIKSQLKKLTLLNIKNTKNEQKHMGDNFKAVTALQFPKELPVLFFLSTDTIQQTDWWEKEHQQQIEGLNKAEIVRLEGTHYLHRSCSDDMAAAIVQFLS